MEDIFTQFVKPLIEALAGHYGKVAQIVGAVAAAMGLVRIIFKPLMVAIEQIVKDTPSQKDDVILNKVETSKAFQIFTFVLDYVLSIKLPQK